MKMIKIKRIYERPSGDDGYRILVDRLWPRRFTKNRAKVDLWLKDIAPSDELRKWFVHDPVKGIEFMKKYFKELDNKKELLTQVIEKAKAQDVTLLYGAKDKDINNAVVLEEYIRAKLRR